MFVSDQPVQSDQSLRCPYEETASLAIKNAPSEDSDQTAQSDLNPRWAHVPAERFLTLQLTGFD